MLQLGEPIRNPTKHFKKDNSPTESNASEKEDQYSLSNDVKHEENTSNIEESIKSSLPIPTNFDFTKDIKATLDRIDKKLRDKLLKNNIKVPKKK